MDTSSGIVSIARKLYYGSTANLVEMLGAPTELACGYCDTPVRTGFECYNLRQGVLVLPNLARWEFSYKCPHCCFRSFWKYFLPEEAMQAMHVIFGKSVRVSDLVFADTVQASALFSGTMVQASDLVPDVDGSSG